ncbi:glycosyltransferase family 2 protein [Rhodococcus sp. NPDC060090]|uniref:glycosyltransferase family 2 protein n=1 Tax=Rhodococcus sp. NPDC060090 TaxID=3347056 RepID=UPI00365DE4D0
MELIAADDSLGAVGRNVAIERVRTPYVSFCDDDTRWQAGALTRAVASSRKIPGSLPSPDAASSPATGVKIH